MINGNKHMLFLKLSSSQSGIFNINQFKLTGKFNSHICDSATSSRLHLLSLQEGVVCWKGRDVTSCHCNEIHKGSEHESQECPCCSALVHGDALNKLAHVPLNSVSCRIHQTGYAPGWLVLALCGCIALLVISLT